MNRFFTKLDLREIRIDPRSSRFPPGADDAGVDESTATAGPDGADRSTGDAVASDGGREGGRWLPDETSGTAGTPDGLPVGVEPARPAAGDAGDDVLKVSARSRPSAVAGAIAGVVREAGRAEVQAIGAGATNQAVKAVAIARDYLQETGIDVICLPAFIDVTIDDEDRTAIRLVIEPR